MKDTPIKKGQLLGVKAPPYYSKEYIYKVTSAGDKLVRADLNGSPTVRKSWSREEFDVLMDMGIVRFVEGNESEPASKGSDS